MIQVQSKELGTLSYFYHPTLTSISLSFLQLSWLGKQGRRISQELTADFAEERDGAFAPPNATRGDASDRGDPINMSTKKSSGAWRALWRHRIPVNTRHHFSLCLWICGLSHGIFPSFQPTSRPGPEEKQRVNLQLIVLHTAKFRPQLIANKVHAVFFFLFMKERGSPRFH